MIAAAGLMLSVGLIWLLFYSRDLPDVKTLSAFAPTSQIQVVDFCSKTVSTAIPYESIGKNLRIALSVAEGGEHGLGIFSKTFRGFSSGMHPRIAPLSSQVARTMFCEPSKVLNRQLNELRVAVQLERHFSHRDLFTIYSNRLSLGTNLTGVQDGSQRFFGKDADQLSLAEAALLGGMVKAPSYYSPLNHPDRAVRRRNEVIDAMAQAQAVGPLEAQSAKASAINVATQQDQNREK